MSQTDLKFVLTSPEPNVTQTVASQSLGGYPSLTEYSISALLADGMSDKTDTMLLTSGIDNPYAVLTDAELMKVADAEVFGEYGDGVLTVSRGQFGSNPEFHISGDTAYAQNKNFLFNGSFSNSGQQYRCIAIQNTNQTTAMQSVKVYVKNAGTNPQSVVSLAIETPVDTVFYSNSTSGTTISLTDSSLATLYADNTFVGRLLVIDDPTSLNFNMARQVASFDGKTGTFTFVNSMAFPIESSKNYLLNQSPSQRISSGRTSHAFGTTNVSPLSTCRGLQNAISLNFSGTRINSDNLMPNEVMYVWFERDVSSNVDKYTDNGFVFTISYRNS